MNNASLAELHHLEAPFNRTFYETLNMNIDNPLKHHKYRARWIAFF